ncbi:helix-turn-helix transcriptional regulator [Pseudonocardia sp. NPDC049635]|uniref:PadR family transcriptional regulator n=1 Tax=Pseudonocardia sp. NPDC049635 TaxID=3155506 RepID=UPI00340AE51D
MEFRDRSTVDHVLLAAVSREPGDGAAVRRAVHERSGARASLPSGLVHRALHRLERNRLVRREPGSRVYRLTASGRRVLRSHDRELDERLGLLRSLRDGDGPLTGGASATADRADRAPDSGPRRSARTAR